MKMTEQQRRGFEEWYLREIDPRAWLARDADGRYEFTEVRGTYAAYCAGVASVVAVPELRNIVEVREFGDFKAVVVFPPCRAAGAFVRGLAAAIKARK